MKRTEKGIIVILCDSFQDAEDAYDMFMDFLEATEPWTITKEDQYGLMVDTDSDLRYIFTEAKYLFMFDTDNDEILSIDEFFEGLPYFYEFCEGTSRSHDGYYKGA